MQNWFGFGGNAHCYLMRWRGYHRLIGIMHACSALIYRHEGFVLKEECQLTGLAIFQV